MGAYLGIDLHPGRSLAVRLNEAGDRLWWRRSDNSPENLAGIVEEAVQHLRHPLAIKGYEKGRAKDDLVDAVDRSSAGPVGVDGDSGGGSQWRPVGVSGWAS